MSTHLDVFVSDDHKIILNNVLGCCHKIILLSTIIIFDESFIATIMRLLREIKNLLQPLKLHVAICILKS